MFKNAILGLFMAVSTVTSQAAVSIPAGGDIHFSPSFASVSVGQVFDVVMQGSGFGNTADATVIDDMTGGQLNLSFANFQIDHIVIDPRWTFTFGNSVGLINPTAGTITGFSFGVFPGTTDDSFNIATITLRAIAPGQATLSVLSGEFAGQVGGAFGVTFNMASQQSLVVTAVPEPSQWAILLLGLGIVGLRLRRR